MVPPHTIVPLQETEPACSGPSPVCSMDIVLLCTKPIQRYNLLNKKVQWNHDFQLQGVACHKIIVLNFSCSFQSKEGLLELKWMKVAKYCSEAWVS